MKSLAMTYYTEKIFFGSVNLVCSYIALLGAIMTDGDARWMLVTLSVGIFLSTTFALMTRYDESMRIVAGRSLFAVFWAVFGTRLLIFVFPGLQNMHDDLLLLGAVSGGVTAVSFTAGYGLIRSMDSEKLSIGKWIKDMIIIMLTKK